MSALSKTRGTSGGVCCVLVGLIHVIITSSSVASFALPDLSNRRYSGRWVRRGGGTALVGGAAGNGATSSTTPFDRRQSATAGDDAGPSPIVAGARWLNDQSLVKPVLDTKAYRTVEYSNGLRVLLISDPAAEVSGAAMNIHAGSYQDPVGFAGLAHFHEHMLFLGTVKYPGEDDYEGFLSTHGGSSNAYTADEDTNYYFDVTSDYLEGALDRFAQFFLCPSFNPEMVGREVKAIDSEHKGNVPDDAWRLQQVFREGLRRGHPASGFSTGNLDTLLAPSPQSGGHGESGSEDKGGESEDGGGCEKRRPLSELHSALVQFHEQWYQAPRMTMCVLGKEPLDELEKKVASTGFGEIRNKDQSSGGGGDAELPAAPSKISSSSSLLTSSSPSMVRDGDAFKFSYPGGTPFDLAGTSQKLEPGTAHRGDHGDTGGEAASASGISGGGGVVRMGMMRKVAPIADMRDLEFTFPLPCPVDAEAKPHRYLSHVIGHEGTGSLHAALQEFGWVEELSAGASMQYDDCSAFKLSLVLTEAGEQNVDFVVDLVFSFLALVREVPPCPLVHNEMALLGDLEFSCREGDGGGGVSGTVSHLSAALLTWRPRLLLRGPGHMKKVKVENGVQGNGGGGGDGSGEDEWSEAEFTAAVGALSAALTPENALVTFVSPSVADAWQQVQEKRQKEQQKVQLTPNEEEEDEEWRVEPYYGVAYTEHVFTDAELGRWKGLANSVLASLRLDDENAADTAGSTRGGGVSSSSDVTVGNVEKGLAKVVLGNDVCVIFRPVPSLNRFIPTDPLPTATATMLIATTSSSPQSPPPSLLPPASLETAAKGKAPLISLVYEDSGTATTAVDDADHDHTSTPLRVWRVAPSAALSTVPKTVVVVHLLSSTAYESPEQAVLGRLFARTVMSDVQSSLYDAACAGCSYSFEASTSGLILHVSGFNSQVPKVVEMILKRATEIADVIISAAAAPAPASLLSSELGSLSVRFETQKELFLQDLLNSELDAPYSQAGYWLRQCVEGEAWHVDEYIKVMSGDDDDTDLNEENEEMEEEKVSSSSSELSASDGNGSHVAVEAGGCGLLDMAIAGRRLLTGRMVEEEEGESRKVRIEVVVTIGGDVGGKSSSDRDDSGDVDSESLLNKHAIAIATKCIRSSLMPVSSSLPSSPSLTPPSVLEGGDRLINGLFPHAVLLPLEEKSSMQTPPLSATTTNTTTKISQGEGPVLRMVIKDETNENSCVQVFLQLSGVEPTAHRHEYHHRGEQSTDGSGDGDDTHGDTNGDAAKSDAEVADVLYDENDGRLSLDPEEQACLDLIGHLAYPSFFQKLRTEEQLGYIVSASSTRLAGSIGLSMLVQSSSSTPKQIQESVDAWASGFGRELEAMSEEELSRNTQAVADTWLQKARSMCDEHDEFCGEVLSRRYGFGRKFKRAQAIVKLDKNTVLSLWRRCLEPGAPHRRSIRLHFYSKAHATGDADVGDDDGGGGGDDGDVKNGDSGRGLVGGSESGSGMIHPTEGASHLAGGGGRVLRNLCDVREFKQGLSRLSSPAKRWEESR